MKVRDLNSTTFNQLIDLECENIIPVLASVGINLDREMMVRELESFNDDHVITYEKNGVVDGFIVYKIEESHILIKTFNLRSSNNRRTLLGLMLKIVKKIKESDIELLVSHCHLTNQKSLNLHRGLGFYENKKTEKLIEFHANTKDILRVIERKTSLLQSK